MPFTFFNSREFLKEYASGKVEKSEGQTLKLRKAKFSKGAEQWLLKSMAVCREGTGVWVWIRTDYCWRKYSKKSSEQ